MRRSSRRATTRIDDPRLHHMKQFGGTLLKKSHAKTARPLSLKRAVHVALHSEQARGEWSLKTGRCRRIIRQVVKNQAMKHGISIREILTHGQDLHLTIKLKNRSSFAPFIRAVSGMLALLITGSGKTRALQKKFWDFRPWTRIVDLVSEFSVVAEAGLLRHLQHIKVLPGLLGRPSILESS